MSVTLAGWRAMWAELGVAAPDEALFHRLVACYSEKHRHYHTLQHLRECFDKLGDERALARRPAEVALALWFHDAYYDVHRADNEARSADWARTEVLRAGLPGEAAERIHALVMATQSHVPVPDADAQLVVDIDLSILGAPEPRFEESDAQIRAEYGHLPEPEFRVGRKQVLENFLSRERLFGTQRFHSAYEAQARANLARSLRRLAG